MRTFIAAVAALALAPAAATAATVPGNLLPGPDYSGSLDGVGAFSTGGDHAGANGTVTFGTDPGAFVRVTAAGAGDHDSGGGMYYYFIVNGAENNVVVPVSLAYTLHVETVKGSSSVDVGAQANVALYGFNGTDGYSLVTPDDTSSMSHSGVLHQTVLTGRASTIMLSGSAITRRGPEASSALAYADPYLYIDADFLAEHPDLTLTLSPGVVNAQADGAVPEPTTWGTMILGFGLIGAAMRRRQVRTALRFA